MIQTVKRAGGFVLDVLFPPRCPWCNKVKGFAASCPCAASLPALSDTLLNPDAERRSHKYIAEMYALYRYEGEVRRCLLRLKFRGEKHLAPPLGQELAGAGIARQHDLVVPIPLYKKRRAERGYNQSALLAKAFCEKTGMEYAEALEKIKNTPRQAMLGRAQRLTNQKGAYRACMDVKGKSILLVDDIVTTGSTLDECARTLLKAGAKSCSAVCVAATGSDYTEKGKEL